MTERRWLAPLVPPALMVCLLLAQTSALMHRIAHGHALPTRAHSAASVLDASMDLAALWGEHRKPADCQALDDLAQASPPVASFALTMGATVAERPALSWASAHLPPLSLYRAQAPPDFV